MSEKKPISCHLRCGCHPQEGSVWPQLWGLCTHRERRAEGPSQVLGGTLLVEVEERPRVEWRRCEREVADAEYPGRPWNQRARVRTAVQPCRATFTTALQEQGLMASGQRIPGGLRGHTFSKRFVVWDRNGTASGQVFGERCLHLTGSREEVTHWERSWCWERLRAGGEGDDRGWDGWMHHWLHGCEFKHSEGHYPGGGEGQGSLACCSSWGRRVGHDGATEQQQ